MLRQTLLSLSVMLAMPAAAATLLTGNKAENTVSFIDLASGKERVRLPTGPMPHEIAISPDGKTAAVVAYGAKQIDLFDVAGAKHLKTIDLGTNTRPHGLLWLPSGRLVATTEGSATLTVVDPARGEVLRSIPTAAKVSHMVAVTPDEKRAFVSNLGSASVSVIDLEKGEKIVDLPADDEVEGIALTPNGRELWVANRAADNVIVYDSASLKPLATIKVGATPIRIQISPDGRTAVTSNFRDGSLSFIDVATRKPVRTVPVSGSADAQQVTIMFSRDGKHLFVAETGLARVVEVELATGKILRRLPAGKGSDGLGYSPVNVTSR